MTANNKARLKMIKGIFEYSKCVLEEERERRKRKNKLFNSALTAEKKLQEGARKWACFCVNKTLFMETGRVADLARVL